MLLKNLIFYLIFNISLNVNGSQGVASLTPANGLKLLKNVMKLTDTLLEITPYINLTIGVIPPNCVQMLCQFVCFNGRSVDIDKDIAVVSEKNNQFCTIIEELRLYSYEFPNNTISYGFLGNYSAKVENLYIASTNITDVQAGAFAGGIFKEIYFENLHIKELRKDFFQGISSSFSLLSVKQKTTPIQVVHADFLCYVKYQIKSLTVQAGLTSVFNLTGSDYILNNLVYTDFSYNDFGDQMEHTAFSKVSMIEHMDLSHSNLDYLPSYIFSDIAATLEYLDLSYNKLKSISGTIFGWRETPRDLKIYANNNEWLCSCYLQMEMKNIFKYYRTTLVCAEPEQFKNWSVFDDEICGENFPKEPVPELTTYNDLGINNIMSSVNDYDEMFVERTTENEELTTRVPNGKKPSSVPKDDLMKINCSAGYSSRNNPISQPINWPLIVFEVKPQENLRVDIIVDRPAALDNVFSLIWFSKVTTQYYKMEINYNEYGLGCYNAISYITTVEDLMPNTAYTFCVVLKNQINTSPFSCKSVHVGGNVAVQYSAWLTRDMRVTGLSLMIFGIILFVFAGIILIYMLLKHKPILLKGSKRVTTLNSNHNEIVVLPKDKSVQIFKEKEQKLARFGNLSCSQKRRKSTDSVASYQSYINSNLYEVIPAYSKLNNQTPLNTSMTEDRSSPHLGKNHESDNCYLTPLETVSSNANLVTYAEIPYRAKRNSNDALPEIPVADQTPLSFALCESSDKSEYAQVGKTYKLDCQV